MKRKHDQPLTPSQLRCAVYARKSTEEGLDQDFNSLDAQRESGEAYVKSQVHEGWACLSQHYSDGGFTGGNMDRPALKRLMADIEAGLVDCVVVYKVDRLSRSLLDFSRLIEVFDKHHVSFVSVTQQFNTASSMGRLMLNVLLSFAQFEREIISERTRDKIAATRRKGKWSGGMPLLGYDVANTKLVVNPVEAQQVGQMYELYLSHLSLLAVVAEIRRRGWTTKRRTTRKGGTRGGQPFTKNRMHQLLTNVTYVGQVRYKEEVHAGEHEAIVDADLFQRVQSALARNGRTGGATVRNKCGALLKGLLHCAACRCAMAHSFATKGKRRYRYYVCTHAQQVGWNACPSPSVPAGEIERFVVNQIRVIGCDPAVVAETLAQLRRQAEDEAKRHKAERDALRRQLRDDGAQLCRLAAVSGRDETSALAQLHERIGQAERRLSEIEAETARVASQEIDDADVARALAEFNNTWAALTPREQARLLELLIERVDHDGQAGNVSITFWPSGITTLAAEIERIEEDAA